MPRRKRQKSGPAKDPSIRLGSRLAWASSATAAAVGGFSLLAILIYVADEHPAAIAGAQTLQASVVSCYGVVLLLGGWVRVGCARLLYGHEDAPSWSGLRGAATPAGPFLYPTCSLYRLFVVCTPFICRLW